jgi:hypothetical protein
LFKLVSVLPVAIVVSPAKTSIPAQNPGQINSFAEIAVSQSRYCGNSKVATGVSGDTISLNTHPFPS